MKRYVSSVSVYGPVRSLISIGAVACRRAALSGEEIATMTALNDSYLVLVDSR